MSEKAYKTMAQTGAANLVLGIVVLVTGITAGVLLLVQGGRLLKNKSNHIGDQNSKQNSKDREDPVFAVYAGGRLSDVLF